jgi:DNA-binding XRE family transcriptional regulator/SOS-response transcriptional repressor LexA
MNYLNQNIKHLRKLKQWTQDDLAQKLDLKRAVIGSYEEGRAVPKIPVMQTISKLFCISLDDLINKNLAEAPSSEIDLSGQSLRVLSTLVDANDKELISVVPVKASAGYLNGYADPEYIEQLPQFNMPVSELSKERTYRVFQISGDSMLPIPSGSYIFCEYVLDWKDIKDGESYVIISQDEGLVYKRLFQSKDKTPTVLLKSDNPEYQSYELALESISEVWKAIGFLSFNLPGEGSTSLENLSLMMLGMKDEIEKLNRKIGHK